MGRVALKNHPNWYRSYNLREMYELLGGSNMQQIYGNFENEKTCSRKSPASSGVPQRRVSSEVCWPSSQCSWKLSQVGLLL